MRPIGKPGDCKLWFEINATKDGATLNDDTQHYPADPNGELGIDIADFAEESLVGLELFHAGTQNDDEDSCDSIFYYYEHQPLRKNSVQILDRNGDAFTVRWSGVTQDVNHYDGTKPEAGVEIDATFTLVRRPT
ncbi:hypothetical protein [Novipirellula caenicola]|uniref:hypothetical protein n=1 Tax=Novipirellula caenicola TaxID=1536901 RepID=UPI0031EE71D3